LLSWRRPFGGRRDVNKKVTNNTWRRHPISAAMAGGPKNDLAALGRGRRIVVVEGAKAPTTRPKDGRRGRSRGDRVFAGASQRTLA
jgi:hypothetical protein